jgi:biotin synthase
MQGFLNAHPTTVYLLTYIEGKCTANCGFCSQARNSKSRADRLSRVTWPVFATADVLQRLSTVAHVGRIRRVCIQALNYAGVFDDLVALVEELKRVRVKLPVSVSCQPLSRERMVRLKEVGVDRIGIPLDAATEEVFERVKGSSAGGPYGWGRQHDVLLEAVEVFGRGSVSTHLIVGLGESEREMVKTVQWCVDNGVYPGLFAFTPLQGTCLEHQPAPRVDNYRRVQLARYLLVQGMTRVEQMAFDEKGCISDFGVSQELVEDVIRSGVPFLTSGCPDCNRPYYNEKPSGPLYNFPTRPTIQEIEEIKKQLDGLVKLG